MVELLKQPQYQPYNVNEQILSIFAGTQGMLDDVPQNEVLKFEAAMLKHFRDEHPEIADELDRTGALSDELAGKVKSVITNFKAGYRKEG
jgi:F-type H+-transporting ATPase subunit alpha